MGYTVDEASDLLGIPRPTLYRYLREYSIPPQRRAGKISIPQESFKRIREARELHREGLGTDSVRKQIRKTNPADTEGLAERLDRLCGALESLQDNLRPDDGVSSRVLQEILAGQRSLTLAVHRLSERVEDALEADDRPSMLPSVGQEEETRDRRPFFDRPESHIVARGDRSGTSDQGTGGPAPEEYPKIRVRRKRRRGFGEARKRRRRGALALLLALLLGGVLVWGLAGWDSGEGEQASSDEQASADEQAGSGEQQAEEESGLPTAVAEVPETVEVPDLAGLTLPQAREQLVRAGLEPGKRAEIESGAAPADTVIAQYPVPGAEADPGDGVNLLFSAGPPATYVPDASGGEPVPNGGTGDGAYALPYEEAPYQEVPYQEEVPPEPF